MVLQALPAKYCQLKVSYNTQGNLWTLDELIAQCVQEEKRLKQDKGKEIEAVNLVHASKGKSKKGGRINPKRRRSTTCLIMASFITAAGWFIFHTYCILIVLVIRGLFNLT
ncbi:unnamed protein product [Malus baccata var. baccata]